MKKVIFIGQTGSGKTTLCQKLNQERLCYRKTQAVEWVGSVIDTPGEYLENPRFYNALTVSAVDAEVVALVSDPTAARSVMPPGFATMFGKTVIGIITKIHQVGEAAVERARQELVQAQARPIFMVDTPEGVGIKDLAEFLEQRDCVLDGDAD